MIISDKTQWDDETPLIQDGRYVGDMDFNFPQDGGTPFLILNSGTFDSEQLRELADFLDRQESRA